ncbi:hypothetical protein B0H19DRAFT_593379 [Mycena capillaripes]|nr:hypothetical protein B0H19DRAFT_593379 [Mycena capillaripes]
MEATARRGMRDLPDEFHIAGDCACAVPRTRSGLPPQAHRFMPVDGIGRTRALAVGTIVPLRMMEVSRAVDDGCRWGWRRSERGDWSWWRIEDCGW